MSDTSLEKITLGKRVAYGAESLVNYIPRRLGEAGEEKLGLVGKVGGWTVGYVAEVAAAGVVGWFIPFGGALPYLVGAMSPILGGYKAVTEPESTDLTHI